jgi:hypothetical protein
MSRKEKELEGPPAYGTCDRPLARLRWWLFCSRDFRTIFSPDLCTGFGLVGDCLLNCGVPRFCQIGLGTSTEDLPL